MGTSDTAAIPSWPPAVSHRGLLRRARERWPSSHFRHAARRVDPWRRPVPWRERLAPARSVASADAPGWPRALASRLLGAMGSSGRVEPSADRPHSEEVSERAASPSDMGVTSTPSGSSALAFFRRLLATTRVKPSSSAAAASAFAAAAASAASFSFSMRAASAVSLAAASAKHLTPCWYSAAYG